MPANVFDIALLGSMLRMATPIFLAALGGTLCAQAGVFNMALEGFMLVAAFSAVAGSYYLHGVGAGLALAVLSSCLFALIFALAVLKLQAHPIVLGTSLNLLADGVTQYLFARMEGSGFSRGASVEGLPNIRLPIIDGIPVVGEILSGHGIIVYVALLLALVIHLLLYKHVLGLRIRAVGQNAEAATTVGLNVSRIRLLAIMLSGVLCALAGAQLSVSNVRLWVTRMTAGRGFIALVAVLFARQRPLPVLAACLFFGFTDALSMRLQAVHIAPQFVLMMPYVFTLIALFVTRGGVGTLLGEGTREAKVADAKSG